MCPSPEKVREGDDYVQIRYPGFETLGTLGVSKTLAKHSSEL